MNTDTPKTDKYFAQEWRPGMPSRADFARELERENARLREALQKIDTQLRLAKTDMDDGGICVMDMAEEVERLVRSILPNVKDETRRRNP